jgi:hypothetical protein
MILYHGTYTDFQTIELDKCRPYKDFGKGFYLTDIEEQASKMAEKKAIIFNGTPIILKYEFDDKLLHNGMLKVRQFDKPNREWAEFIYNNRSRSCNFRHDYDIVTGPIANDSVAYLLDRYEEGTLSLDELAHELEFRELNFQYCFGSESAIKYLKRL